MAKAKASKTVAAPAEPAPITTFKAFNPNLTCRDFQFEIGKTFSIEGPVEACRSGFHACEYPIDCFNYYPPGGSRFFEVQQSGDLSRHAADTKVASARITIGVELSLGDMVQRAVKWIVAQAKPEDTKHSTGYQSAASATGHQSAASATGDRSAASATGDRSAASATGYRSAASATDKHSTACGLGIDTRAQAGETGAIFLVNRDEYSGAIRHVFASKVGENGIKPGVFYTLSDAGQPVEIA